MTKCRALTHPMWIIPIIVILVTTILSRWIDIPISRYFYRPESADRFSNNAFYQFIYDYAAYPAWIIWAMASLTYLLSFVRSSLKSLRKPALLLFLTLVIGAGFITHTLLKDHWGRPRPKQTVEFGGIQEFRPIYRPNFWNQPQPSKSFPCGHCTMGFYFFAFVFIGKRLQKPLITRFGWISALTLGFLLSLARIAQGGHFFSDTVITASIMWLTAAACDWLLYAEHE